MQMNYRYYIRDHVIFKFGSRLVGMSTKGGGSGKTI